MLKVSEATKYDVSACILPTKYVDFSPRFPTQKKQPLREPFYITEIINYNFCFESGRVSGIKSA